MSTAELTKTAARQNNWEQATGFKGFIYKNRYILLSFLVPFVIMTAAFAVMSVSPFGDKQILVTDLWHQYFPFLADFQEKLKTGDSLFYTWSIGGGTNYFALASYYLASPLNFLTVLIPGSWLGEGSNWLREFLMFSVVVKIACAGMFMAMFLRYVYKKNDYSLIMFSVCFALCSFFMGYYWNTIWLDTVALTPLVAMGTVAVLKEGRFKLFIISLAVSVLANYYIGLFTCIFVAIIFVGYSILHFKGFKNFFINLGKMAGYSSVALALTAFLILPAYFALQNTHASSSTFPSTYAINLGTPADFMGTLDAVRKVIANSLSFIMPNTKEADRAPNIACGTICIVLCALYFAVKKIKLREKLLSLGILTFFTLSFVIRQLDYMWHGFHFTNMIPYRFSYLFSFVMVAMAFRVFTVIDSINFLDVILAALCTTVIILLAIGVPNIELYSIIGTAAVAVVLIIVLFLFAKNFIPKRVLAIVMFLVVMAESAAAGYIGVRTTTVTTTFDYPRGEQNTAAVINEMNNREKDTTELWRAEMTSTQTLNDGALNHYDGISMFNSMVNETATIFMENFGLMGWQSGNRYTYAESSPVTDLFFNLKYLISRDGNYNNKYSYSEVFSSGNVKLLENSKYIPMGFMTKPELADWSYTTAEDTYNPIKQQNSFFKLATGVSDDVYTPVQVATQSHTEYEKFPVNKTSYGNYTFSCKDSTLTAPHLQWNYTIPQTGYYYAYTYISNGENVNILQNNVQRGTSVYIRRPYIMSLGQYNQGDTLSITSDLKANATGTAQIYLAKFNEDVFEEGFNELNKSYMTTTKLTGSSMEGTINAAEDGLFFTSIPYEEGWTASVDGQPVNIKPIGNCLLAFELDKGQHNIVISFVPKGFVPGLIITILGLGAFVIAIIIFTKYRKRHPYVEPVEEDEPKQERPGKREKKNKKKTLPAAQKKKTKKQGKKRK